MEDSASIPTKLVLRRDEGYRNLITKIKKYEHEDSPGSQPTSPVVKYINPPTHLRGDGDVESVQKDMA